jgi:integrase/recombinase XerD
MAMHWLPRPPTKKISALYRWVHKRHTYATHTLLALQRSRDRNQIEPLVFLQHQLGHASINTTMVYLHLINELADEAVLAYDDELNEWAAEH